MLLLLLLLYLPLLQLVRPAGVACVQQRAAAQDSSQQGAQPAAERLVPLYSMVCGAGVCNSSSISISSNKHTSQFS
jgi:hypothetical protein